MPEVTAIASVSASDSEEFIKDPQTLAIKHSLMNKMKKSEMYNSISDTAKSIAGPILGVGMGLAIPAIIAGTLFTSTMGLGALAVVGVGLAATGISVITGYLSSHIYHGSSFDQSEFNAKDTARHLVKKLREHHIIMSGDDESPSRADGKRWQDVVRQQTPVAQVQ